MMVGLVEAGLGFNFVKRFGLYSGHVGGVQTVVLLIFFKESVQIQTLLHQVLKL